ncbi:hypothetical protein AOQ84DRAFT_94655 [Glonium stellatum]|uniref:Uncharacterized protein n=1 Tax=Glonium stellatum TaxID=574774 RepID=A0A8E2EVA2_9PEZI|nr:hypothetical protein AOQ84DRAFT_94655 [Glonium stellatum]
MDVEILVHISAPTTRHDDDHFRAQALAYLDFEPCHEAPIIQSERVDERPEDRMPIIKHLEESPSPKSGRLLNVENSIERAGSDLYGSFPFATPLSAFSDEQPSPNHSFRSDPDESSIRLSSNSRIGQLELIQTLWKTQQRLGISPSNGRRPTSAVVSDSVIFYEESQFAAAALQSQLLDSPSSSFESEVQLSNVNSEPLESLHSQLENRLTSRAGKDSENDSRHVSALPNLPPKSLEHHEHSEINRPIFSTLSRESHMIHSIPEPSYEVGRGQSSEMQFMRGVNGTSRPMSIKRAQPEFKKGYKRGTEGQLLSGEDGIRLERDESHQSTQGSSSDAALCLSIPLEVLPPGPRVSEFTPTTWPSQSTEALNMLKDAPENSGRFKPACTTRELAVDERGYWKIETANWHYKLQYTLWHDLANFIRRGDAGWGITLHREPPSSKNESYGGVNGLGQVQLYCWGELVEHTYLLLWLYSNGKVQGSGLQWIDSADAVVVQMP